MKSPNHLQKGMPSGFVGAGAQDRGAGRVTMTRGFAQVQLLCLEWRLPRTRTGGWGATEVPAASFGNLCTNVDRALDFMV